ncbi:MAG: undecaprenyl-phosphate glucose phosphotransferase [Bacteroidales bacterium]|nr:undecaprenyl-phosphate glucose phosphotransferase [Bacteroidales bacterium]
MQRRQGKSSYIPYLIVLGDFLIINILFLLLFYYPWSWRTTNVLVYDRQMLLALNVSYIIIAYFTIDNHHKRIFEIENVLRLAFYTVSYHFVVFYILFNFLELYMISFKFLAIYFSSFFISLSTWWIIGRFLIKCYRKNGYNFRNVVILGAGKNGVDLANHIGDDPSNGFRLLGYFDDDKNIDTGSLPLLGKVDDVDQYIIDHSVDEIYCALAVNDGDRIVRILDFAEKNMVKFFIIPGYYTYLKRKVELHMVNGVPILSLFSDPLEHGFNRIVKRVFDVVFALFVLLIIFPPIYIFTAIAIRLSSPGPIFFKQTRTGLKGENFDCYKFRTMKVNDDSDKLQAVKNDPRKTKVGDFLRKTNIDEIPQFLNVLKGDMSVVGPRPHMLKHTEDYSALIDTYMIRHFVKPGVTGWAQVKGFRGETKELRQMEKRVEKDVWYIENWSLWLDIKIVIMTVVNVFKGEKNAY